MRGFGGGPVLQYLDGGASVLQAAIKAEHRSLTTSDCGLIFRSENLKYSNIFLACSIQRDPPVSFKPAVRQRQFLGEFLQSRL